MMHVLTKKEKREHLKELLRFCKENHCLMWNYMLVIKQIRKEPEEKILEERIKKQIKDSQSNEKENKEDKK